MKKPSLFILFWFLLFSAQAQWWPEVRVTNDPNSSYSSIRRCVAANGDTVHIAWFDNSEGKYVINYVRSADAGLNWDTEQQLTYAIEYDQQPSIVASASYVHMVWMKHVLFTFFDDEIYYKKSTNVGTDWGSDIPLTNSGGLKYYPAIAISGPYVHVVWSDECYGDWEIYYIRSVDNGETWDEKYRLTNQPNLSRCPTVASSGAVVHVVWHDNRDGNTEIYYKRSSDNGTNWGEDTRLTLSSGNSRIPEIDVSGSFVNIVWQDDRSGDYEIYSISSMDGGLTWGQEQRLTYESSPSEFVCISVSGAESHLVWQDLRSGMNQIFYKNGHNYGTNWDEDERLINTLYNAYFPSVAFSGEWAHVVWYDERDGNYEIYCKNKYVENPIGINEESLDVEGMEWSIYPNPASSQLTIAPPPSLPQLGEGEREGADGRQQSRYYIKILNIQGYVMKEIENIASFPYIIDISGIINGIYFLQVIGVDGKTCSRKFLKMEE